MKEQWILLNKQVDYKSLSEKYNVPSVIIKLMVNRGLCEEDMSGYLHNDISTLANPLLMKGVKESADILMKVATNRERIAIVSDYDCDGIFSGMILETGLEKIGAVPVMYTPDRVTDGYGINKRLIDEIYNQGINYIITCDNGIAAYDEVVYAKELGMTVIITDHHEIPFVNESQENNEFEVKYIIPPADAVCNPKQVDCDYPYKGLCGAGVAYRLIDYMYSINDIPFEERKILLQYAAIATIADIMELTGENRVIVKTGLNYLSGKSGIGLEAMKEINDLSGKRISVYHIGFVLGPCFNAAGRLENVKPAFNLLRSDNVEQAREYAANLKNLNDERKILTEEGVEKGIKLIEGYSDDKVMVIIIEDCHESVAGIIAGRIKEIIYKPVIVFTKVENGMCKGSGRSIPAYDMFTELSACKDLFEKFGGHAMAAGITMKEEYVDELRRRLNVNCRLEPKDMIPVVRIDAEVLFRHMNENIINSLHVMEPFGNGNPKPLFCGRNINVKRASIIGRNRKILKLVLIDQIGDTIEAVYFGEYEEFLSMVEDRYGRGETDKMLSGAANEVRMAFTFYPEINEYNGLRRVQLVIQNYDIIS